MKIGSVVKGKIAGESGCCDRDTGTLEKARFHNFSAH